MTAALADLVVSAVLTAVTVTEVVVLTAGAVNKPLELIEPLLTFQETAVFEAPVTEAVNCCVF